MFSGKLDRRIIFETKTTSRNAYGEETTSWAVSFTTWAHVIELKGKESFEASQLTEVADVKIKIRYRTGVNVDDYRLFYNSKYYDIYSFSELGRQDGLEIFAKLLQVT